MRTRVKEPEIPKIEWDEEEERALEARLIAAGYKMPTKSLNRPRTLPKKRPRWKVFFIRIYRFFASLVRGED